jgi:hypothetical protein
MNTSRYTDLSLAFDKDMKEFLPEPVELDKLEGRYGIETMVSCPVNFDWYSKDDLRYLIKSAWDRMYRQYADYIVSITIGRDDWLVHKATAEASWMPYESYFPAIRLRLYVDMFVAPTRQVYVPEIVWEYSAFGGYHAKEWRCGYCKSPNEMKERHCTQCGSPRAKLIQEM